LLCTIAVLAAMYMAVLYCTV